MNHAAFQTEKALESHIPKQGVEIMDNEAIVIDINGQEKPLKDPKICITFKGSNNKFKIYEPYFIQSKLTVQMVSNGNIEIKQDLKVYDKLFIATKHYNDVIIDESFHCHSVFIYNWTEPYLKIEIGKKCLFSSEISLRTSDGHSIFDISEPDIAINTPQYGIKIGDHVWIGRGVDILKDVTIEHDCVIGTRSLVTSGIYKHNSIVAGIPAKTLREYINWDARNTFDYNHIHKNNK